MKSLFKKISAVLMVAVLMFCAIPFTASANSGYCGDNVTYSFDSSTGVLTISGTGPMYDWDPNDNPFRNSDIDVYAKEIIINYGVTAIGECAFSCLSNVTDVYIPNSVTEIRMGAFSECWSLININIPDSVISIGLASFECCESLESITIPNSVTYVAESAFDECISLKSVTISNNLTEISDSMFEECELLTEITIGNKVKSIGEGAFAGCYALSKITIPNSVTTIEAGAFFYCNSLTDIYYEGTQAQWNKISVDNTENGNTSLLNANFHFTGTATFDTPTENPTKPANGFPSTTPSEYSTELITLPEDETNAKPDNKNIINSEIKTESGILYWEINLDDGSFKIWGEGKMPEWSSIDDVPWHDYADIIVSIEIGDGVKNIGNYAFADFIKITIIIIPQGTTSIGENAFCGCENLESVVVPQSVEKIEAGAFDGCDSLEEVKYEGSQEDWEEIEIDVDGNSALEKAKIKLNYNYEDSNNTKIIVIVVIIVVVAVLVTVLIVIANKKKAEAIN